MQKKTDAGTPRDWMDFVKSDLDAVRLLMRSRLWCVGESSRKPLKKP